MKKRILIVEDDREFALLAGEFLENQLYSVTLKYDGSDINSIVDVMNPDIILMDRFLPSGVDGLNIVKQMRERGVDIPVIFISSLVNEDEVVKGLGLGCCEYIKKPFGLKELELRIERCLKFSEIEKVMFSKKYYLEEKCAVINGENVIRLQNNENILLKLLMDKQEQVCKTDVIIRVIWGDKDLDYLNRLDVLVNKLRDKLKGLPYVIENHKKIGYSLKMQQTNI